MTPDRHRRLSLLLFGIYFLEAGLFLTLAPWSRFWMQRVVLRAPTPLQRPLESHFFRGFVTGLGLLHLAVAARDLSVRRRSSAHAEEGSDASEAAAREVRS